MEFGRLRPIAQVVVVDIAAPLVAYALLRSAGLSTVAALLLSGVFPAAAVAVGVVRHRHLDAIGTVVLASIVVGAVLGLISHSAKPVLAEGSVITGVFGLTCLASLRTRRPLMYALALEFTGPDTDRGQEMVQLWRHEEFRHLFRVITAVWGAGFLLEAAVKVVIVENTSAGTALASSQVLPIVWAAVLCAWTVAYGNYHRKQGERAAAAAAGAADQDPPQRLERSLYCGSGWFTPAGRRGVVRGNPAGIRDCPAAVSGNDRRHQHWASSRPGKRRPVGGLRARVAPASPKTCHRPRAGRRAVIRGFAGKPGRGEMCRLL